MKALALPTILVLLIPAGCDDRGSGTVLHPESLSRIQLPPDARLIGSWEQDGLTDYFAYDMPAEAVEDFLRQPLFKDLSEKILTFHLVDKPDLPWWRPNEGVAIARRNGMLPDKRGLHIAVNRGSQTEHGKRRVIVYLHKLDV